MALALGAPAWVLGADLAALLHPLLCLLASRLPLPVLYAARLTCPPLLHPPLSACLQGQDQLL